MTIVVFATLFNRRYGNYRGINAAYIKGLHDTTGLARFLRSAMRTPLAAAGDLPVNDPLKEIVARLTAHELVPYLGPSVLRGVVDRHTRPAATGRQ